MKKWVKILIYIILLIAIVCAFFIWQTSESLPLGQKGPKADKLAHNMLKALHFDNYKNTRYLEWSFREIHHYKWDKDSNKIDVIWDKNHALIFPDTPSRDSLLSSAEGLSLEEKKILLKKAKDYFNNDSFWLTAPYKVFDNGVERKWVNYEGKPALLITYTSGGSTPGDSYLWILNKEGEPISYKMWVSIIPTGGVEASWSDWITTSSGALLPTSHRIMGRTLDMGEVKGYN